LVMPAVNCMDTKFTPLTQFLAATAFNHECGAPGTSTWVARRAISRQRKRRKVPRGSGGGVLPDVPGNWGFTGEIL